MGQSLAQQVIPPSDVYWPSATSRKNTGSPPPNRKMKYGIRNAPVEERQQKSSELCSEGFVIHSDGWLLPTSTVFITKVRETPDIP